MPKVVRKFYRDGVEYKIKFGPTVQVFDFQNDGQLGWAKSYEYRTGVVQFTSGQGWYVYYSADTEGAIQPPSTVYKGELKKVIIDWYKPTVPTSTSTKSYGIGTGLYIPSGTQLRWHHAGASVNNDRYLLVSGGNHIVNTVSLTGNIKQEMEIKSDGSLDLILNGTKYNIGYNSGTDFKTARTNKNLSIYLGNRGGNAGWYVRKVTFISEE